VVLTVAEALAGYLIHPYDERNLYLYLMYIGATHSVQRRAHIARAPRASGAAARPHGGTQLRAAFRRPAAAGRRRSRSPPQDLRGNSHVGVDWLLLARVWPRVLG
jgi:hypothetical protein